MFTLFAVICTCLPVALALAATAEYLATQQELKWLSRERSMALAVYHDDDNSCHRINETSTHELKKLKAESTPKKVIKSLLKIAKKKTVIDHGLLEEKRWVRVQS